MKEFTIYCTPEQTKKALELGAPIKTSPNLCKQFFLADGVIVEEELIIYSPSAEQMLGWLRSKGFKFKIAEYNEDTGWYYHIGDCFKFGTEKYYKDAVFAVIDAALNHLMELYTV